MPKRICVLCLLLIATARAFGEHGQPLPVLDPDAAPFSDIPLYEKKPPGQADAKTNDSNNKTKTNDEVKQEKPGDKIDPEIARSRRKAFDEIRFVNNLGDPEALVFNGVSLFSEDQLRLALSCDMKYQVAARPSNETGEYLSTLEKRLLEGYLHSGCPDAKVNAHRDGKREAFVVDIEEGQQFHKGQIHIVDSKTIDGEAVIKLLTNPQTARPWTYTFAKPAETPPTEEQAQNKDGKKTATSKDDDSPSTFWKTGDAFDFRDTAQADAESTIRQAFADLGYAGCRFHVEQKRDTAKGVVDLQITMLEDAPRTVAGNIEIKGLKRDSRESLLKYLEIAKGDVIDAPTLQRINDRLTDSCRYWMHTVDVSLESDATTSDATHPHQATLNLDLEEYEPSPPLDKPLSATDETVRKCAAWLKSIGTDLGGYDVVCSTESVNAGSGAHQAQFGLASDGSLFVEATITSTQGLSTNHTLILSPPAVEVYDWNNKDKFCLSRPYRPKFTMQMPAQHSNDGKQASCMCLGFSFDGADASATNADRRSRFHIEPAVLLQFVSKMDAKSESRDGILTLKSNTLEIRIDEKTGALRALKGASFLDAGVTAIDFKSEPGLVRKLSENARKRGADFDNQYDDANPIGSFLSYAAQQIERQPVVEIVPTISHVCQRAAKAFNSEPVKLLFANWTEEWDERNGQKSADNFEIPGTRTSPPDDWATILAQYLPLIADKAFPRGSWPWTACREAAFMALSNGEADDNRDQYSVRSGKEVTHWLERCDDGPVSALIVAEYLKDNYPQKSAAQLVGGATNKGLHDLSDEAFLRDVHMLTKGDRALAVVCRTIVENCGDISTDDEAEILEFLPDEFHDIFKQLVARRTGKPTEPPGDALEAVLLTSWHNGWKDIVETELRNCSTEVAHASEKSAVTK